MAEAAEWYAERVDGLGDRFLLGSNRTDATDRLALDASAGA
jgi:hypothetical protein